MHELSLCQAIADTVAVHADGRPVARVAVRIGHLRQIVPDSLQFSWELLTDGTGLEGCALDVEHVPAVLRCSRCAATTELDLPVMMCASCGSTAVELVSGEEFLIASIDVTEEVC